LQFETIPGKQFTRPYLENTHHKNRAGGVAQVVGPEFKPQHHKKKKKRVPNSRWETDCSSGQEKLLAKVILGHPSQKR
jgi:hypothetical protein